MLQSVNCCVIYLQTSRMKAEILTAVFTRLRPSLTASAQSVLSGNDADVKDALQEAFCRLWHNRDRLEDELHARAASYVAVKSAAIDMLRRRRPTVDADALQETGDTADTDVADSDLYREVSRIIERELTQREHEVLMMRDRQEFELDAIAARLDISEANVRVILSRARRKVRECYRNRSKNKI